MIGNTLKEVLVSKLATKGELAVGCGFIPCQYNGGDIPSSYPDVTSVSGDHRFFGPTGNAENGWDMRKLDAWPVIRRETSPGSFQCLVPDFPENVAILEAMKERPEYGRVEVEGGHKWAKTGKMLPPLYTRLDQDNGSSASMGGLSDADLQDTAERILRELQARKQPAAPTPPAAVAPVEPLPLDISALTGDAAVDAVSSALDASKAKIATAEATLKNHAATQGDKDAALAVVQFETKAIAIFERQFEDIK
jgi:hypothetical protein